MNKGFFPSHLNFWATRSKGGLFPLVSVVPPGSHSGLIPVCSLPSCWKPAEFPGMSFLSDQLRVETLPSPSSHGQRRYWQPDSVTPEVPNKLMPKLFRAWWNESYLLYLCKAFSACSTTKVVSNKDFGGSFWVISWGGFLFCFLLFCSTPYVGSRIIIVPWDVQPEVLWYSKRWLHLRQPPWRILLLLIVQVTPFSFKES